MELAWMDNAGFGGPRILKQNPSGPVWDMTQWSCVGYDPLNY